MSEPTRTQLLNMDDETFNAVMDRQQDAVSRVYSLRPGHVLTQADYDAIQIYDQISREDGERAVDSFHAGYTQGLREGGSTDIEKLSARLSEKSSALAVEKAMRQFAENRLDETTQHVRDFIRALDGGYLECKDDSAFIDALRAIANSGAGLPAARKDAPHA